MAFLKKCWLRLENTGKSEKKRGGKNMNAKKSAIDEFDERIKKDKENKAKEEKKAKQNERGEDPIQMKVTENGGKKVAEMDKNAEAKKNGSSAQKPKGLWPGERMFAEDPIYWTLAGVLWFVLLIILNILAGKISILVSILWVGAALMYLSMFAGETIPEYMRAKPVFFGVIGKKISWGTVLVLKPKGKLILFPTGPQQITLTGGAVEKDATKTGAGIQTTAGWAEIEYKDEKGAIQKVRKWVSEIVLPVKPVFNFRWPSDDDDLTEAIKNAPPPDDLVALEDKIGELILDIIRSIGGKYTYIWLLQNRDLLADEINEALKLTVEEAKEFDDPANDVAGKAPANSKKALAQMIHLMRLRNPTVSFKDMDLHQKLLDAQIAEAAAVHTGEAARIILEKEGEGSKKKIEYIGQGTAYAEALLRSKILDVLTTEKYEKVAVLLEQLKAFQEASKTGKATVILPSGMLDMLGSSLGKVSGKENMSAEEIIAMVMPMLKKMLDEQGKK